MDIFLNNILPFSFVFLSVLVAFFAMQAFNKPPYEYKNTYNRDVAHSYIKSLEPSLPKYMTEKSKYNFFLFLFVFISIALYALLGALIDSKVAVLFGLAEKPAASYFASALIIIGISSVDSNKYAWVKFLLIDSVRKWLHGYANTPKKGRELFNVLCDSPIDYESEVAKKYIHGLLNKNPLGKDDRKDVTLADFKAGGEATIERMWARLSYCIWVVEYSNSKDIYKGHLNEESLGWPGINSDYNQMIARILKEKGKELTEDEQVALDEDLTELMGRAFRLISCLLLMVCRSDEDPISWLIQYGFDVKAEERYFISSKEVVIVVSSVFASIFLLPIIISVAYALIYSKSIDVTFTEIFVFIASGISILVVPILVVMIMKRVLCPNGTWPLHKDGKVDRKYFIYFVVSLMSWMISTALMMLLMVFLESIEYQNINEDTSYISMMLYSLISALTAYFVAYRIDIPRIIFKSRVRRLLWRVKGGVMQGLATALLTWVCLMIDMYGGVMVPPSDIADFEKSRLLIYTAMAFTTGFIIFVSIFFTKHLYEKRKDIRRMTNETSEALIDGVNHKIKLLDIARGGVSFMLDQAASISKGDIVELLIGRGDPRSGIIVLNDNGVIHLEYLYGN